LFLLYNSQLVKKEVTTGSTRNMTAAENAAAKTNCPVIDPSNFVTG
jgi:hypothetical protein